MARIQAYAFDADAAREHLGWIGDSIHLVSIHRAAGKPVNARWFGTDIDAALAWAMAENREQRGIYFTVNRVPDNFHRKPADSDIVSCRFVHVDLDPDKSGTGTFDYAAVMETLEGLQHPPSFVVSSGGGAQAFWRIEESHNRDAIKRINMQVRGMFNADNCQDVSRLMRLAGTVNYVNAAKAARGRKDAMTSILMADTGEITEPATLAAFFPEPEQPAEAVQRIAATVGDVRLLTCDDFAFTPFHPVRRAVEKPAGGDRSQWVYHAACAMVRADLSDSDMAGLLLNPANKVSAHLLDQADPRRACERAIGGARGEETPIAEVDVTALALPKKEALPVVEHDWRDGLSGPMRLMVETILTYAPSPRPELALGAALALFGTAMGRRYQTPSGLMSNLYIVGLSPSGSGKDLPVNAPGQVLMLAGEEGARMVGGDIVSARGIMSAIEASPTLYIPADEIGKLIQAIQDPRGNLKEAITVLLKMYSASQSIFKGGMYANSKERPTTIINRPCLGFYGVSNPQAFWEKLTHSSISDGLLPRFILLPDTIEDKPPPRRLKRAIYPDALVDAVKACMRGADGHIAFPMGNGASVSPKPYEVPYADGAADDIEYELRMRQYRMESEVEPDMRPFVRRSAENAMKLALVRAVTANPGKPVLTAHDMEWGWAVSERSVREFMAKAAGNISENDQEAKVKRILARIEMAGSEGIGLSELGRRFQQMTKREREDILHDLEESGLIRHTKTTAESGRGRPVVKYYAIINE